jgi:hypothetical protein
MNICLLIGLSRERKRGCTLSAIGTAQRIDMPLATCDKSIRPLLDVSNALNIASISAADLLTQIHAEAGSYTFIKRSKNVSIISNIGEVGVVLWITLRTLMFLDPNFLQVALTSTLHSKTVTEINCHLGLLPPKSTNNTIWIGHKDIKTTHAFVQKHQYRYIK